MMDFPDLSDPAYTPVRLLHATAQALGAANDHQLARLLEISPGNLTRIQSRTQPLGARVIVQILDRTGWTMAQLRKLAGIEFDGPTAMALIRDEFAPRRGKLTDAQVLEVKHSSERNCDAARRLGVDATLICHIRKGRQRQHV
jgi:hypothetical protein